MVWALNIGVTCINCYIGNDSQPTGPSGAWGRLVYNAIEMPNPGIDNAGDAWVSLTLAPNPLAGDVLRVGYDPIHLGPAGVTLLDVSGRAVMKRDLTGSCAGQLSLDLRFLGAGVYLVRLDDGRQSLVRKLVVQR